MKRKKAGGGMKKEEVKPMFVYQVDQMNLCFWHAIKNTETPHDLIGSCVRAAKALQAQVEEYKDWDGNGEYWFAPLPFCDSLCIVCRPNGNPYSEAYIISPVEMPWVKK